MKSYFLAIFSILVVLGQLSAQVVVEQPAFSVRNNENFEIEKIVIDKKSTTLHVRGYMRGWQGRDKVDKDIYTNLVHKMIYLNN